MFEKEILEREGKTCGGVLISAQASLKVDFP